MGDTSTQISYEITAENGPFVRAMDGAASATKQATATIQSQMESVNSAFNKVHKTFLALTAVIAGGAAFKSVISESVAWAGESGKLAKALGTTVEKASVLNVALSKAGVESDQYLGAAAKLSAKIGEQPELFGKLGVAIKDTHGNFRPMGEVLTDVSSKLSQIKNPVEQNIAGVKLFGEEWSSLKGILKLNADALQAAEQRARDLGLIVGAEGAAQAGQYKAQLKDLNLVAKSLEIQFGSALLPVFVKTGGFMAQEGPEAGKAFARVLETVGFAASAAWMTIKQAGNGMAATAAMAAAILRGDLAGAKTVWDAFGQSSDQNFKAIKAQWAGLYQDMPKPPSADPDINSGPHVDLGKDKKEKGAEDRMGQWEAELSEQKLVLAERARADGTFRQMSKEEEFRYWQAILEKGGLTHKELLAVRKKVAEDGTTADKQAFEARLEMLKSEREEAGKNYTERIRVANEAYAATALAYGAESKEAKQAYAEVLAEKRAAVEQMRVLESSAADARRERAAAEIELERVAIEERVSLGEMTREQALVAEQAFENRLYAIKLQALQERQALIDPDRDPVAFDQANRQIEQAEIQHNQRLAQLRSQTNIEADKGFGGMLKSMESGWGSLLAKMAQGQMTLGGMIRGLFQNTFQVVTQTIGQLAAKWVAQRLGLSSLETMLTGKQVAEQTAASTSTVVAKKAEAAAVIPAEAAVAAGGAASAVAQIPIVGPALAAAAFAETMGMVMGGLAVASASGGYDIPAGVNPVVQTHAKEMILPAKYADVIRGMAEAGGSAGADSSALSVSVHAVDSRDVVRSLTRGGALYKALAAGNRRFQKV